MKKKGKLKIHRIIILAAVIILLIYGITMLIGVVVDKDENTSEESESIEHENESEEETKKSSEIEEKPVDDTETPTEEHEGKNTSKDIVIVENPEAIDVLVNRTHTLPDTYIPGDLVELTDMPTVLSNPEVNQMRKPAYEALKELFAAAEEDGYDLYARSGYRSYNTQVSLYDSYAVAHGKEAADTFSAKAGQSEHQTGLVMDITCEAMNFQLDDTFGETEEGKWVSKNAHKYGFIVRYPKEKEDITGYMYEPWHLRYLGVELATNVYESGLSLDEYFEQ